MASRLGAVGVVIVHYDSGDVIQAALQGLPLAHLAGVVIVDNASPDGGPDLVRSLERPGVTVVEAPSNRGFGAGCNLGFRSFPTPPELVLFLNPDARVTGTALQRLVEWLDDHRDAAVVAPRLERDGLPIHSAGGRPTFLTELRPLVPAALGRMLPARRLPPEFAVEGPVAYVEGACMLARSAAFEQVGGFDEGYFLYFEEVDLARRLQAHGWTVELCPTAVAEHVVGASTSQTSFGATPHKMASTFRYLKCWSSPWTARAWWGTATVSWWLRRRTGRLAAAEAAAYREAVARARLGR